MFTTKMTTTTNKNKQLILLISLIALVANFAAVLASGSILEDCSKDALATVSKVTVTGCDFDKDPFCSLKKGTDAAITVELTPKSEIDQAKVNIGAKIGGLFVPFPLKPDDACQAYGLKCPMAKDSKQVLTLGLPIKPAYPSPPNMKVQFKLHDAAKKDIICISFPAKIVS